MVAPVKLPAAAPRRAGSTNKTKSIIPINAAESMVPIAKFLTGVAKITTTKSNTQTNRSFRTVDFSAPCGVIMLSYCSIL